MHISTYFFTSSLVCNLHVAFFSSARWFAPHVNMTYDPLPDTQWSGSPHLFLVRPQVSFARMERCNKWLCNTRSTYTVGYVGCSITYRFRSMSSADYQTVHCISFFFRSAKRLRGYYVRYIWSILYWSSLQVRALYVLPPFSSIG